MAKYTWDSSKKFCDTEVHKTQATCADCPATQCAGCEQTIPAGQPHSICRENGEAVHPGCKAKAAARWVDYF